MGESIVKKKQFKHPFFAILIPVYNGEKYLAGCLDSILSQTLSDSIHIFLFDDCSDDKSFRIMRDYAKSHPNIHISTAVGDKCWNGGARNRLMEILRDSGIRPTYTLFMDDDDTLVGNDVLERALLVASANNYPDVVRLSYNKKNPDGSIVTKIIDDYSPADMARSSKVAPWTKMVFTQISRGTDLLVPFPENTLFEDVVQHLALADVAGTVVSTDFPVVEWNRQNQSSVSTAITPKRKSSAFRFIADLMDLPLTKPYTIGRREAKIRDACKHFGIDYDSLKWVDICC